MYFVSICGSIHKLKKNAYIEISLSNGSSTMLNLFLLFMSLFFYLAHLVKLHINKILIIIVKLFFAVLV